MHILYYFLNEIIWYQTILFHFHEIFKNGGGGQALIIVNPLSSIIRMSSGEVINKGSDFIWEFRKLPFPSHLGKYFDKIGKISAKTHLLYLLYLFSGRIQFWNLQPRCVRFKKLVALMDSFSEAVNCL